MHACIHLANYIVHVCMCTFNRHQDYYSGLWTIPMNNSNLSCGFSLCPANFPVWMAAESPSVVSVATFIVLVSTGECKFGLGSQIATHNRDGLLSPDDLKEGHCILKQERSKGHLIKPDMLQFAPFLYHFARHVHVYCIHVSSSKELGLISFLVHVGLYVCKFCMFVSSSFVTFQNFRTRCHSNWQWFATLQL